MSQADWAESPPEITWGTLYRYGHVPVKLHRASLTRDFDGVACALTFMYVHGEPGGDARERPETLPLVGSPAGLMFSYHGETFLITREDWTVTDPCLTPKGEVIEGQLGAVFTIQGADPLQAQQHREQIQQMRRSIRAQAEILPRMQREHGDGDSA